MPYEGLREEMRDAGRSILRRGFNSPLLQTVQVCNVRTVEILRERHPNPASLRFQGEMADAVRSPEASYAKSVTVRGRCINNGPSVSSRIQ